MKKIALVALLISAFTVSVFARGKQIVAYEKIPVEVQEELQKNFSPDDIQLITEQKVAPRRFVYTFTINDATQIKYNNRVQLLEVANAKGIKTLFVPERILNYIQKSLPNATITKYEVGLGKKVVVLNDELTLIFTTYDKFLRIED